MDAWWGGCSYVAEGDRVRKKLNECYMSAHALTYEFNEIFVAFWQIKIS